MAKIIIPLTITVDDPDLARELSALAEIIKDIELPLSLGAGQKWRRLTKAWIDFIEDCERIQYGVLSEIHLEHGIPVWGVVVSEDGQAKRKLKWS